MHPAITRIPISELDSCGREFYEQGKQAVKGRCAIQIGDPSSLVLGLTQRTGQFMAIFREGSVGERELAGGIKGLCKCRRVVGVKAPVGSPVPILGAEMVQRLFGSPGVVVIQTVAKQQRELKQPRTERGLRVETAAAVFVFYKGSEF